MTAPVRCRRCHRRLTSEYADRRLGPKCGGRLRKGRRVGLRVVRPRAPAEPCEEQLGLFEVTP